MQIQLEINGHPVTVREGATIMEAAQKLRVYVPHFCYHPKLSIAANCRMCMVDVEKAAKAVPACATPAVANMVVRTDSERAKKAQNGVMEFLLINHPLDCPICDQGGECQLQDLAVGYGVSRSRYQEEKRVVFEKNLGPLIATDMTRCIHCTRCVRFGREVAGIMELGMTGRGEHAEIMPFVERTVDSELSGNMIDICPVGALTSKPFRYTARTWELRPRDTVGTHDSWGSHLCAHTKNDQIKRILPSRAEGIVEPWISDRDRFSYQGLAAPDRARTPMACEDGGKILKEKPWRDVLASCAAHLRHARQHHGPDSIGFFISPRAGNEEAILLSRIAAHLGCKNIDSRLWQRDFTGADIAGLGIAPAALSRLKNVLFIGAEPARELPLLAAHLRARKKLNIFALSAGDIASHIAAPPHHQLLLPPGAMAAAVARLLTATKAPDAAPLPKKIAAALPKNAAAVLKTIAAQFAKSEAGDSVIWLGDVARAAPDYGAIAALAQRLAAHCNAAIGTLADGGNGVGVRRAGAIPPRDGKNTAAMLRADLRAIVLYRCEPADFAESAAARRLLQNADTVCAITPYTGGIHAYATTVLPAAEFTESDGTYTNGFGADSMVSAAVPPPDQARPGWKILRMLGEFLQIPEFNFADIATPRAWLSQTAPPPPSTAPAAAPPPLSPPPTALQLHGGAPAYGGDMLVRRAPALSQTRQARASQTARLHPDDMATHQLSDGARIAIGDADAPSDAATEETTVTSDPTLAPGVIAYTPQHLAGGAGFRLHPPAQKTVPSSQTS